MNSVVERLLESWLGSQTELRYQPAFVQLLVSEGWTVHHNTRHTSLEFGKDVIARSPDGILHSFQLKGNPGTRVTKGEAQKLLPQLFELIQLPVRPELGRRGKEKHVAVFVTNGEIDEDARLLFATKAECIGEPGVAASELQLWARGDLLKRFLEPTNLVWPTSIDGTRLMLDVLSGDGRESPDPKQFSELVRIMAPAADISDNGRIAAIKSLLVVAEILKSRWYASDNHWALHAATVLVAMAALRFAKSQSDRVVIADFAASSVGHCRDLLDDAERLGWTLDGVWWDRDALAELDFMHERNRLVADAAAVLALHGDTSDPALRSRVVPLLERTVREPRLWGASGIPPLLMRFWAWRRHDATIAPEFALAATLQATMAAADGRGGMEPLPSPYYDFLDCWAAEVGAAHLTDSGIAEDTFDRRAWFSRAMLMMLAKRNMKATCRRLWPMFSRQIHEEPQLPGHVFFDAGLSREGDVRIITYMTGDWQELVEEAVTIGEVDFLAGLDGLEWLVAAYVSLVPYRAWTSVLMWLDARLDRTWYHAGHLAS
jgi:hypothetical protein